MTIIAAESVSQRSVVASTSEPRQSIKELLLPLFIQVGTSADNLRADSVGFWRVGENRYWLPRFVFRGTNSEEPPIKVAIFAGIHGDETAGVLALIDFLRFMEENPFLGRAFHLSIYPLCNPTGYEDGTRVSRSGKDRADAIATSCLRTRVDGDYSPVSANDFLRGRFVVFCRRV